MKIVKEYEYKGFSVTIRAKFETDGADVSTSIVTTVLSDCVKLEATIERHGVVVGRVERVATPNSIYTKSHIFSRKNYLSFRETYESRLKNLIKEVKRVIDIRLYEEGVMKSDMEITDGLPDSLDDYEEDKNV